MTGRRAKRAKPVVHRRDHEHGGMDPVRIHYEDVGTGGTPVTTAFATIKAYMNTTSLPPGGSSVGNTDDDFAWTYLYELPHPQLLYVDPDTHLITRDLYDLGESRGALYLVMLHAGMSSVGDAGYGSVQANRADFAATDDSLARGAPVSSEIVLHSGYVVAGGPPDRAELHHDNSSAVTVRVTLSVNLIHPGPVPL